MVVVIDTGRLPVVTTKRSTEYVPAARPTGSTMKKELDAPPATGDSLVPMPTGALVLLLQTAKTTTDCEVGLRLEYVTLIPVYPLSVAFPGVPTTAND